MIAFAIGFVVLSGVAHQIGERKSVVDRGVIDAGARTAAIMIKEISRGRHAPANISDQVSVAGPIPSQRPAKVIVPFRPAGRKPTDLISAEPNIPRFGEHLYRLK